MNKPINYLLNRWEGFARLVHDGRICMTNNAAERALRCFALGRKAWLFAGSDRGAERAAVMATLIMTARLNNIDPKAWLADLFARIADMPQNRLHELFALELDASCVEVLRSGGVAMHVNKVYAVFTISRVAKDLG